MEKKDKKMIRSGGVDPHHENHESNHDQYSELLEGVPIDYARSVEWKLVAITELDPAEIKFVKGMERFIIHEFDEIDQERLKVVETLNARLMNLNDALAYKATINFSCLWTATENTHIKALFKCLTYLITSFQSTAKLFDNEDIDISVLADLAGTQLENIKAYNSENLALLEVKNLNEVTLQDISNQYSTFYKGIRSLNMKIEILKFHTTHPRCDLKALVDRFSAALEGELRQYEEELETNMSKVIQLIINQSCYPDSWTATFLSTVIVKPISHLTRLLVERDWYSKLHNSRSYEKDKDL